MKRYEALAEEIADSIRRRVLKRGDRLPSVRQASAGRKVSPSMAHEDVVPFGSAFPSPLLSPLHRLGRALAATAPRLDPWSTVDDLTPGNAELRRQIALRYLLGGLQVDADGIVITNGALEALNLCIGAITGPGDAVLVEAPCFYATPQILERRRLRAIGVPTHPRQGIELEAVEVAIARHAPKACWIMSNFQNAGREHAGRAQAHGRLFPVAGNRRPAPTRLRSNAVPPDSASASLRARCSRPAAASGTVCGSTAGIPSMRASAAR